MDSFVVAAAGARVSGGAMLFRSSRNRKRITDMLLLRAWLPQDQITDREGCTSGSLLVRVFILFYDFVFIKVWSLFIPSIIRT